MQKVRASERSREYKSPPTVRDCMPVQNLKSQIAHLPEQPGVYLFANETGETIYIGKARSLRDRVRSYLGARGLHPKTDALLDEAAGLEVIVTDSVVEALALENHLVKERSPRYNIRLRDDKNYPYLQLTTNEAFPRVLVARSVERDGTYYAGPFMPASLARRTMGLTHRLFGIRSCNEVITGNRERPCLEYDIKRCIAPCVAAICSQEQYAEAVQRTQLFFEGKNEELDRSARRLDDRRRRRRAVRRSGASARCRAHCSDAARSPAEDRHGAHGRSRRVRPPHGTGRGGRARVRDARGAECWSASSSRRTKAFPDRRRRSCRRRSSSSTKIARLRPRFICRATPKMRELLEAWLSARAGRRVQVLVPKRGEKRGLVDLAVRNARIAYQAQADRHRPVAVRRARDASLDAGLAGHSATHRVLRHLDDSGQRNRGVDGRVRRRQDAEERLSRSTASRRRITPDRTTSPR